MKTGFIKICVPSARVSIIFSSFEKFRDDTQIVNLTYSLDITQIVQDVPFRSNKYPNVADLNRTSTGCHIADVPVRFSFEITGISYLMSCYLFMSS